MRGRKRRGDASDELVAMSQPGYWIGRNRQLQRRLWLAQRLVILRDSWVQFRLDSRLVASLARRAVLAVLGAAVIFASSEAASAGLNRIVNWGPLFKPISVDSYGGFVGVVVGAQAAFLALFFTTVGVIASTSYARVPSEIRSLFVRERSSLLYVWSVTEALMIGMALLTMPLTTGSSPHAFTVLVFSAITVFSIISLVLLGTTLFNFFDLTTLSTPLFGRFVRGANTATVKGSRQPDQAQQRAAHERVAEVIRIYRQLAILIQERDTTESRAPERISRELLRCWSTIVSLKSRIPTKSSWFGTSPAHPNWLTMSHPQLGMALATRTSVQPSFDPDATWAEQGIAHCIEQLLSTLVDAAELGRVIRVVDLGNKLINTLAEHLQLDEAKILRTTLRSVLRHLRRVDNHGEIDPAATIQGSSGLVFRLASVDREVLGYTQFWLGLVRVFEGINDDSLSSALTSAVETAHAPYGIDAPRPLLEFLEFAAAGICFEMRAEGKRISPQWWINHHAARVLSEMIQDSVISFVDDVRVEVIEPIVAEEGEVAEIAATQIFGALELLQKVSTHMPAAHNALRILAGFEHEPSKDEQWPAKSLPDDSAEIFEERLHFKLAAVGTRLSHKPHDKSLPDLFGQSYKTLFDATFAAIINGRTELSRATFPSVMLMAGRARERLLSDLSGQPTRLQLVFGTEPLLDLMELSGYSIFMNELEGHGIWDDVRLLWDRWFSRGGHELMVSLMAVLQVHETTYALTPGGIGRSDRQLKLGRALSGRNSAFRGSPIVAAFAAWAGFGIRHDLADLFVVEYLMKCQDMSGMQANRGAENLAESIELHRTRLGRESEASE